MKNIIAYYYDLHPNDISFLNNKYFFSYQNNNYVLQEIKRPLADIDALYEINSKLLDNDIMIHKMIMNNKNNIITYIDNKPHLLLEIYINPNAKINLKDICYFNNKTVNTDCNNKIGRYNWVNLWETKNDYFETQISEIGKKYPNVSCYINYYIGLAENAITYIKNAFMINQNMDLCISHKRIKNKDTLYDLYNPLNMIYDYKVRDVSEYIKSSFFNNYDSFRLVKDYFSNNYITYKEALLFYGRMLYPSYFFDLYDDIVNENLDESVIETYILKANDYEIFLLQIHNYISTLYNLYIPEIDWLIKRSF